MKKLLMIMICFIGSSSSGLVCAIGYHDLIPYFIPQHKLDKQASSELLSLVQKDNLRSEYVYDQFQTVALFDVLRYSTATVASVAQIKSDKYGIGATKARQEVVNNELMRSANELIFLVQADVRNAIETSLTKKSCPWTFLLVAPDGQTFVPEVKKMKHTDMTKTLFGEKYSKFKTPYIFSFALPCNSQKFKFLRHGALQLIFRSREHEVTFRWSSEL